MFSAVAPKFGEVVQDAILKSPQAMEINAPFIAYPKPSAEFLFNGTSPEKNPFAITETDETLCITLSESQRPGDCGTVTLKIKNDFGEDAVDVNLTVLGEFQLVERAPYQLAEQVSYQLVEGRPIS